jgi:pimeloyl-ACP methyl ester carboxylesterase
MPPKIITHQIKWKPRINNHVLDASIDVSIHTQHTQNVLLIVPGVDGAVDGYKDKYIKIADRATEKGYAVVRMSNPFLSSFLWEDNVRYALKHVIDNSKKYFGTKDIGISIFAHSAGASVVAAIAHEYAQIKQILLVNSAEKLMTDKQLAGINAYRGKLVVVYGQKDPSIAFGHLLVQAAAPNTNPIYKTVPNADHNFAGVPISNFIKLVDMLVDEQPNLKNE